MTDEPTQTSQTPQATPLDDAGQMNLIDPVDLARRLIRCQSVTPEDDGALALLEDAIARLGFINHGLVFSADGTPKIKNLYARVEGNADSNGPNFCFAGHTDVVPVGDKSAWSVDPFGGEVIDGRLMGRGAADMKGAIACFVAACARFIDGRNGEFDGAISLLITGDEEGPAINGTAKVLDWLDERAEKIDVCLVGEPSNPTLLGESVKIGRRGSLNGVLRVTGVAGHVAYPHLADNPIAIMLPLLNALTGEAFDEGNAHFQPSALVLTSVDVGNDATNVIPSTASAAFNIRFNDVHTGASLEKHLRTILDGAAGEAGKGKYELSVEVSGEAFITEPGEFTDLLSNAIESVSGIEPELNTKGGTSDARFIRRVAPVAEFGLVGATMHKADEQVSLEDMEQLTRIYLAILEGYFPKP